MATLNTRIQLRYDTFANWEAKNPELLAGEIAIATTADTVNSSEEGKGAGHPVLFKVGPGNFNSLPWASALAADVHSWAKKSEADFKNWVRTLITVDDISLTDYYKKTEVDGLLSANSEADQAYAAGLVAGLNVTDSAVTGEYVSAVSEAGGKISVSREKLPVYTLASGTKNGTVAFNGADVSVTGLGSAAYTASSDYATAAQGALAASAVQSVVTGVTNGTIKVDGAEVAVAGLGSAAFAATTAFDAAGAAADAQAAAIAAAKTETENQIKALDATVNQTAGADGLALSVTQVDGKITAVSGSIAANTYDEYGTAENKVSALANGAVKANTDAIAEINNETTGILASAKAYTDKVKGEILGEGITETYDTLVEIQNWIETSGVDATDLTNAIAAETAERKAAVKGVQDQIDALGIEDGKVSEAAYADEASHADDADSLGGSAAAEYLLKADAPGYADILTKTSAATLYQPVGNYKTKQSVVADPTASGTTLSFIDSISQNENGVITVSKKTVDGSGFATAAQGALAATAVQPAALNSYYTKTEADAAFMDSAEVDAKITALNLAATYEPIGAESKAKAYADSLAGNYATKAQGVKADTALQEVAAGEGLKVTNKNKVEFDTAVTFVLNCGDASSYSAS